MKTWMVTGLHDPKWLGNILSNYERQTHPSKGLILVENGQGIDATSPEKGDRVSVILRSEPGPAQPLNAALAWLRSHASPDDWFAKCDSDDYYGPSYLDSIQEAVKSEADYAGRPDLFIKTQSGHLWLASRNLRGFCDEVANGPTLCARVASSEDFPVVQYWGEDSLWCSSMQEKGNRFYALAPEGMCYQRWSDNAHTWPCTDIEIIAGCSVPIWDLGLWNPDVVDGLVPRPQGVRVEAPPLTLENSMSTRVLMESLSPEMRTALEAGPVALSELMQRTLPKGEQV